ncbi:hypothetical protein WKW79_21830 [Variovorax robiniae]|uniref:PilC beta-propeller domain-containing protein n=1 Tax=Variovorax robiniae TaxID=1836199 RepID=A0ABU8XBL7_9BURK
MAAQLSKDAGIAYRYGPDSASCGATDTGPALFKRNDAQLIVPGTAVNNFFYQIGTPSGTPGNFSTNQANMVYVADDPATRVGVTDFQVSGYMYNTFAQLPQLSWTGAHLDSATVTDYKKAGTVSGNPIAVTRCVMAGFCAQSVVVYQNGVIATSGTNTSINKATATLPANKVPTAVAMTNDSEYALVTVWDTTALKGQVAVVALAGMCDGCTVGNPGAWYNWWWEWKGVYPGLPNMGNIGFMKILGYVDLPGMTAPTEIAVTTGMHPWKTIQTGGEFIGLSNSPLSANWQKFASGGANYGRYAKGAVAVVISKSEQKVAFVDLKPLFNFVNGVYFSSRNGETTSVGAGDGQWPYTFANSPSQTPTVVKTVSLPNRPTAVKAAISGSAVQAWVATQDGTLRIYSLGGYAPGESVASPAPSAIAELGSVTGIGRNPTSLATSRNEPSSGSVDAINQQVIVSSRGDRKISWVRFSGNGGSIVRSFQHNLLVDPVGVEDSDNFANQNNVLSVADYNGKAVRNYRYGPVVFSDGGYCANTSACPVQATGTTPVEYGGAMSVPGKPFQVSTTNTP